MSDLISRCELFNRLATIPAPPEANDFKAEIYQIINEMETADIVRCKDCMWARPRTLKGETGYRCIFYRVDKAESGFCDNGERSE